MLKIILITLLPLLLLFGNGWGPSLTGTDRKGPEGNTGTLEKMIVANGIVTMSLDPSISGGKGSAPSVLRFDAEHDAFFTILVFNGELRGAVPSAMALTPQGSAVLPAKLDASYRQLAVESTDWGSQYELVVRDSKTGFVFFNVEGQSSDYDSDQHLLSIQSGRLLLSKEFAAALGRPADSGAVVGQISISAAMRAIEVTKIVNDEVRSDVLPATPNAGSVPGPDVIVGDLNGLTQPDPAAGTRVGLAVGTDSCNFGTVDLDWFALPDNDHPVIPQNMYRMSGGATNDERFEQIGQSSVKHAFTALTQNICSLGCNGVGNTHLGSGCSDPYVASLNSGGSGHTLGSRAWINPFTGAFPRGDSATPPNSHTGHTHDGTSHRILVEVNDLNTSMNSGATYYAEAMYVTPHEYTWCQSHAGQCNMNNNVSYRQYTVSGTSSPFGFTAAASTVRQKSAVGAWSGATFVPMQPDAANDGVGTVAYKVTNPSPGVWHYEYAVYNQNMDRGIQSFSVPVGSGATLSNIGFHAPPQQPGWAADGTVGNAGFSNTPWTPVQAGGSITWSSETFAQNQNANAIRWGTLYNFRFDSNSPPQTISATVGFFKTGAPITVQIQGPSATAVSTFTVSGRVFTNSGMPIRGATVVIQDQANGTRYYLSSPFGYYVFDSLPAGSYTVSISSKRYTFNPQNIQVNGDMSNVDFTALP